MGLIQDNGVSCIIARAAQFGSILRGFSHNPRSTLAEPIYFIWAVAKKFYQRAGAPRTRISDLGKIAEIYQNQKFPIFQEKSGHLIMTNRLMCKSNLLDFTAEIERKSKKDRRNQLPIQRGLIQRPPEAEAGMLTSRAGAATTRGRCYYI